MKMTLRAFAVLALTTSLVACGVDKAIQSANDIPGKMDETNRNMGKMVQGVHDQSLLIPMEAILNEDNHDALSPVPFKLMPYGKKFAEAATASELVELTYLWMKEVDESLPQKDIDENGSEVPYTMKQVARINNQKIARLVALQVIAGFAPQSTVDEIVRTQIIGDASEGSRRFEKAALSFLMFRTMFIRDVMLQESLLAGSLDNVGAVEEAIKYGRQLDIIAKYRFANRIAFKTRGLIGADGVQLPSDEQPSDQFNADVAGNMWMKISDKAHADLQVQPREVGNNSDEDKRLYVAEQKRAEKAFATLDAYLKSWNLVP